MIAGETPGSTPLLFFSVLTFQTSNHSQPPLCQCSPQRHSVAPRPFASSPAPCSLSCLGVASFLSTRPPFRPPPAPRISCPLLQFAPVSVPCLRPLSHLDMQKEERGVYYKHRIKGLRGEAVSVMVDSMDQSKLILPHTKVPPKDASNLLETKITGVLVHGKRFDAYISEPQVPSDLNLDLTCIHTTLMKLKRDAPGGVLPRKLYLPVDGGSK